MNRRCLHAFDSEAANPTCPHCRGRPCKWVPGLTNVAAGKARAVDQDVRALTDQYGLTNIRSPERGRNNIVPPPGGEIVSFRPRAAQGWQGQFLRNKDGSVNAMCTPTGITAKMPAKNIIDRPLTKQEWDIPGFNNKQKLSDVTAVEATHRPARGIPK